MLVELMPEVNPTGGTMLGIEVVCGSITGEGCVLAITEQTEGDSGAFGFIKVWGPNGFEVGEDLKELTGD